MHKIKVELGERSYPIFIGEGLLAKLGEMLQLYELAGSGLAVTDSVVNRIYGDRLASLFQESGCAFGIVALPAGEKAKSLKNVEMLVTRMLEMGLDRRATVLAFGGGVVGDLAGFVASIYKRGIRLVQVPTTLLAQVDASIGGKTGVNHRMGKNMVGTIHQPRLVWCDTDLLRTLPRRELVSGLGEVVKYAVLRDGGLFARLEEELDAVLALQQPLVGEIVRQCCEIKAEVVSKDEQEQGVRAILNFGHTIGHALEASLGFRKISHGEAVLAGMLAESKMALETGVLPRDDFNRIRDLLLRFPLGKKVRQVRPEELFQFLRNDKKAAGQQPRFVWPEKIGKVIVVENVEPGLVESGVAYMMDAH